MRPRAGRLAGLAASAALVCGCSGDPETKIVDATAVDHGAALFRDPSISGTTFNVYACSTCHEAVDGDAGDKRLPGAPLAGAALRPYYWGGQETELLGAINHCLYYFMLKDEPWTPDDVEARAIYAYLESLPADEAAAAAFPFTPVYAVKEPPPGDAGRGEIVYEQACSWCHGRARSGSGRLTTLAPVLPDQTLAEHPLSEYTERERRLVFVQKVRHGAFVGYGGQMPPFSRELLSEQDLGDLLSFFGLP